ncbi:unnamed protein product [Phytophthora fragariaefolia]|uniref:Unnamed protein product n=1 Tax=Phytophthora fragariaefolia TaxID=1490495 RepID=A0A9W6YEV8_9STRA|nr:unnamed protein product [Phytophthora fragariaefolia]
MGHALGKLLKLFGKQWWGLSGTAAMERNVADASLGDRGGCSARGWLNGPPPGLIKLHTAKPAIAYDGGFPYLHDAVLFYEAPKTEEGKPGRPNKKEATLKSNQPSILQYFKLAQKPSSSSGLGIIHRIIVPLVLYMYRQITVFSAGGTRCSVNITPMTFASLDPSAVIDELPSLVYSESMDIEALGDLTEQQTLCPKPRRGRQPSSIYYERKKNERVALKTQLAQLLEILEREKTRQLRARDLNVTGSPRNPVWKRLARQHLNDRLVAEVRQKWLKAAVTAKNALLDDLIALAYQYIRTSVVLAQQQGPYVDSVLQPSDELVYAMYIHELGSSYQQTDHVFAQCGMGFKEENVEFRRSMITDGGTEFVELSWRNVFPFTFERACKTMWMVARVLNRQEARENYQTEDPDNTISVKLRATRQLPNGSCDALVHRFVYRRFVEENRVVQMWKSSIIGDGRFRGMQLDETGWWTIQPSASGTATTVTQACVHHIPLHRCSARETPPLLAEQFEQFAQSMAHENSLESIRVINSLLLDDALDGINIKDI